MSAAMKRAVVGQLMQEQGFSERRACRLLGLSRSVKQYQGKRETDAEIAKQLRRLAERHPRWGCKKLGDALRGAGYAWNHKRIHRVYQNLKLQVRVKPRKRLPRRQPQALQASASANGCWSMDFMSDALLNGRRFRSFNVIDDFNRQALAIEIDASLPALRIVRVLEQIAAVRGYPQRVRVDNGPEFTSKCFAQWAELHQVYIDFIQPGRPAQNAYIERFNRTYREEVLDAHLFASLSEVRQMTHTWLDSYNHERPHDALQGLPPVAFAKLP